MANKWITQLRKIEGAVTEKYDPYANVLRTPSPGVNWTFGRTHGLPFGYSMLLWGRPKAGKSLLSNATIGQLHRDDPEAIVVKYDTEMRDEGQMTEETAATFGIDLDRYMVYQVNNPKEVFDNFRVEVGSLIAKGAPVKLCIIDSITGVQGRREAESESVTQHLIGDHAHTVQIGLKSILGLQRRHRIALIVTAHARAEMDMLQQKRGNKEKAAASFGVLHHCEYFMFVSRNDNQEGRKDLLGNEFRDESRKDFSGGKTTGDQTGHRIKVWMQDSSVGAKDREAEFTIDYQNGIVNIHEEVFQLGINWGIIDHPNPKTYVIDGKSFNGKPACLKALQESQELQTFITKTLLKMESEKRVFTTGTAPSHEDEAEAAFDEAE